MAITMYKIDPYVDSSHTIELPSCMYRLENVHKTSVRLLFCARALPVILHFLQLMSETVATSLTELERRQVGILNKLSALKSRVQDLTRKFDLKMAAAPAEYNHVVFHASPKNDTKPFVIMLRHISKVLTCHGQVYVHSGLTGETEKQLMGLLDGLSQTEDNAALRVTWIWKKGILYTTLNYVHGCLEDCL